MAEIEKEQNGLQKIIVQEIDYDKLAEAIVKAQSTKESICDEEQPKKKKNIVKAILDVIFNKNKADGMFLSETMIMLIQGIFNYLAVLFVILAIGVTYIGIGMVVLLVQEKTFIKELFIASMACFACTPISFMMAIVMRAIANDVKNEKDKNYLVAILSSIIGIAALIVALIALFKGVR